MSSDNLYRCDGCNRSWRKVRAGPMLDDSVWHRIARQQDILCDSCVRTRIERVLGRPMEFPDMSVCMFNVFTGYFDEMAPPGLIDLMRTD
jgi:hypothetical protein